MDCFILCHSKKFSSSTSHVNRYFTLLFASNALGARQLEAFLVVASKTLLAVLHPRLLKGENDVFASAMLAKMALSFADHTTDHMLNSQVHLRLEPFVVNAQLDGAELIQRKHGRSLDLEQVLEFSLEDVALLPHDPTLG